MNKEATHYVNRIVQSFEGQGNEENARWSKKYLRDQFEFLGVRTPLRKELLKKMMKEHGVPKKEHVREIVETLWERQEREYQYAALEILMKMKKQLTPEDMEWLTQLVVTKSWWDTIDVLAPHIFSYLFSVYPELLDEYAERWIEDDNMWLQRSAILYQLKHKDKTDTERLNRYIVHRATSEEFFVQKAIGWVLREYAKTNPEYVRQFVAETPLKPLSVREALKHIRK